MGRIFDVTIEIRHGSVLDQKDAEVIAIDIYSQTLFLKTKQRYGKPLEDQLAKRDVRKEIFEASLNDPEGPKSIYFTNSNKWKEEDDKIIQIVFKLLERASQMGKSSIAIPTINWLYNYQFNQKIIRQHIDAYIIFAGNYSVQNPGSLKKVIFSLYSDEELGIFIDALLEKEDLLHFMHYFCKDKVSEIELKREEEKNLHEESKEPSYNSISYTDSSNIPLQIAYQNQCLYCKSQLEENQMGSLFQCCMICKFCVFKNKIIRCPYHDTEFLSQYQAWYEYVQNCFWCRQCNEIYQMQNFCSSCQDMCFYCLEKYNRNTPQENWRCPICEIKAQNQY